MAENSQSITIASLLPNTELRDIVPMTVPRKLVGKLCIISVYNILVGVTAIGLDIGLHINDGFSLLSGTVNGLYMIFVGILILILRREEIYILANFFILIFFQLFFILLPLATYIFLIFSPQERCRNSYGRGCEPKNLIIINLSVLILLLTICMIIYSLTVIRNGRRARITSLSATYHSQHTVTTENIE
ncbi:hypothetical protein I4U23_003484 [Adineta vaga]|nr:hypothetical protein I4U23_003484 [Adineta vaga]